MHCLEAKQGLRLLAFGLPSLPIQGSPVVPRGALLLERSLELYRQRPKND